MNHIDLIEKDLRFKIIGFAMEIINEVGCGFREKTYENALIVDLKLNNVNFSQQKSYQVYYKNEIIDNFIPDLVIEDKLIIELKTVESITDEHIGQLINYLKVSNIKVGLILNFKHTKLEWKPIVL